MGHALLFALDHQANRWTLHTTRRKTAIDLAPQNWRNRVAVEAVQNAAGLGGVDQFVVDRTGVGDRGVDRGLGDFVKYHSLGLDLGLEVVEEVAGDGLALAVFVGRYI